MTTLPSENFGSSNECNSIGQEHHVNISTISRTPSSQPVLLNLPCNDLLHGIRQDFNGICIPLYQAATTGNLEAAKAIIDKRPELVRFSITESFETTLHIAVLGKSSRFVEYLMSMMTKEDLELPNGNGETSLFLVARTGNVEIAKILVERNLSLIDIPDRQGRMPLHVAALFGRHDMVKYLYDNSQEMSGNLWTHQNQSWVLEACVENELFDIALQIVTDLPKLAINGSLLRILAQKPHAFLVFVPGLFFRIILSIFPVIRMMIPPEVDWRAFQLLRIILREIMKLPKAEIDDIIRGPPDQTEEDAKQKYSSRVLFVAAEMGNRSFLVEVFRKYPHLAREVNDNNQSVFHVAVSHRHERIFKLLYENDHIKDLIITLEDENGNNMLHLVGDHTTRKQTLSVNKFALESAKGNMPGMGLRLNRELRWYRQVRAILPPCFRDMKNAVGLTPSEVFTKNHKDLFFNEQKLMKETATQLMVVAALVATISFAAVFTFPGGYKQDTGIPIFLRKNLSKIFVIFDSLSFISSTTSILMVLSILGSDYGAYDLMISLPSQFTICLASVFFSIITIIFTFVINLSLLYQSNLVWMPTIISASAAIPCLVFVIIRYRLYAIIYVFVPSLYSH